MAAKTWTGSWWKSGGGGTVWNATYDPEFQSVYIGVGNSLLQRLRMASTFCVSTYSRTAEIFPPSISNTKQYSFS
jgi:glucose dehydrogenase